jgi:hypothetical protein
MNHPADMTPEQRVDEIASILSIGIIRMHLKKLSKNKDNSLDCLQEKSVYDVPEEVKKHE